MLSNDELVALQKVLHSKVVEQEVLDEELEHLVVELEGEGGVDEHPLDHLVQAAGCRWRSKSVESQVAGGSLRQLEDSPEGGFEQRNT